ncbi:MAG: hypothetical protein ABSB79_12510 [Syntrophales bacterium]|jgi:hypothetical protein
MELKICGQKELEEMVRFEAIIRGSITEDKVAINLEAFDLGQKILTS